MTLSKDARFHKNNSKTLLDGDDNDINNASFQALLTTLILQHGTNTRTMITSTDTRVSILITPEEYCQY